MAVQTLDILAAAPEILSSELLSGVEISEDSTLQERVIMADVVKATALLERIETMIKSGEENHVNRHGETSVVPMRVDSTAKLLHAWTRLADVRAARSGVATEIRRVLGDSESQTNNTLLVLGDPEATEAMHILTEKIAQAKARAQLPQPDAQK